MGRPYHQELDALTGTYSWARNLDVRPLQSVVNPLHGHQLLVVGSGGSLSAAHLASALHERRVGNLARACTPLELDAALERVGKAAVLILSAGGRNSDVLAALRNSVRYEVPHLAVMCGSVGTPLGRMTKSAQFAGLFEFAVPGGKDGFLAVNSLLAFVVLLARCFDDPERLPTSLPELMGAPDVASFLRARTDGDLERVLQRETMLVLYGPETKASAIDIESKLTEAALSRVLIADFRNFAHGRHHWLAKRSAESAVLALTTQWDNELASRTLSLLPGDIPKTSVNLTGTADQGVVTSFLCALGLVGEVGRIRGIDPGRPGVPEFGRLVYHLRVPAQPKKPLNTQIREAALRRKVAAAGIAPAFITDTLWEQALVCQIEKLRSRSFGALLFDYDGTLCSAEERFTGPSAEISSRLNGLLQSCIPIGVATGRGGSVRKDLQRVIAPAFWQHVFIGYYNGAEIGSLADNTRPDNREDVCPSLSQVKNALLADAQLGTSCDLSCRPFQITITDRTGSVSTDTRWTWVSRRLCGLQAPGTSIVVSSHSVDVLAPGVSKLALVRCLQQNLTAPRGVAVLCIGDRGRWPGNDSELLQHECALSVDEVSPDPHSCWNLAPPGCRGIKATIFYMDRMQTTSGGFHLNLPEVRRL